VAAAPTPARGFSRLGPWLIIGAAVLAVSAPVIVHPALPIGSDIYATMHYVEGFRKAFSEGDLLPRWTDRTNQNLGGPSFVLFPPCFYYLAAGASGIAGSDIAGVRLAIVILSLLTALSFHLMAREWIGPGLAAAAATALYLVLPYHVLDIYQRFAMSESAAFVFFPLILLFARRLLEGGGGLDFAGLAVAYAGLIATHLVSAFAFSLFLGAFMIWEGRGRLRSLATTAAALACGVGLASPVLLPAMIEKSYVNVQWVREAPNADFRNNFIFRDDPIPGLGFKDPVKPPVVKSAHSQLLLAGVAAAIALAGLGDDERRRRAVKALAAACGIAYLLQLEITTPIWKIVPELATIQFPWRFQMIMVLTAAGLSGLALHAARSQSHAKGWAPRAGFTPALTVLGVVAAVNVLLGAQNALLKPFVFDEAALEVPGVIDWVDPTLTPVEYTAYRDIRRIRLEFPRAAFTEGKGEVTVRRWLSSTRALDIRSEEGGTVLVRSFWFPGWTATLDGTPLSIGSAPPYGAVSFRAPPGAHVVEMRFEPTPLRRGAAWTGVAFVGVTAGLALVSFRRSVRTPEAA